ncbi:MAG TPA: PAC2 family protein [archaeon]|nr:PAC2 family protein [archaeon]
MKQETKKVINFIETKNVSLKGFTLIEGFPDLGLAGTIGARYFVEKLKFEEIGFIDSKFILPITRISNGVPVHPIRIYVSKKNKLVVLISEQIIDNKSGYFMAKELTEWIVKKGIKRVITTSGVKMPEGKNVYAFASDDKAKKIIKENKIELINDGVTSGVTALLMLYLKDNHIESICILGNARNNADYDSAIEVVKVISSITKTKIDVAPLVEQAKKMQAILASQLKEIDKGQGKETKIDSVSTPMYT